MLKIRKLNQYYGQSHILWDIDMDISKGKCTVLMGRNGVGKTTLLRCIMGLQQVRDGSISYLEQELLQHNAERRANLGIGYVPQGRQIFPLLTVEENILIGLPARRDNIRKIPDLLYELFPVLYEMKQRHGGDLSGGQQQQLAIARALALDPKLLILDEPTEGIQPNIVQSIGELIGKLNKELGITVLLVEQKLPFARSVGDQFCILDRGKHVRNGEMTALDHDTVQRYLTV